ncbi:MAG: DUF971 domain-containing protein [Pseudomonadales bacterium]|nr:DUF971 domain-containing protein [Pseudomonadales bacterium]MBO6564927.1 DUF971 domain-containing protein [Pseudomonadales bacterium]MBO6597746.1 DUF971 domain-containing protein [Pseudomonadales bacterium]MBO6823984.1 DUF971 domain-containing protein [Pseudomonadales bacterium]
MSRPREINVHKKSAILELVYEDGSSHSLTAEYLRVFSPSAEVQGHGPGESVLQFGKKDVQFLDFEPQGNYAIKIVFSDGHDSGIYSWTYLAKLGTDYKANWSGYLEALEAAGKRREPQFIALS